MVAKPCRLRTADGPARPILPEPRLPNSGSATSASMAAGANVVPLGPVADRAAILPSDRRRVVVGTEQAVDDVALARERPGEGHDVVLDEVGQAGPDFLLDRPAQADGQYGFRPALQLAD